MAVHGNRGSRGLLHTTDPSYKGSGYNVKVLWSDGTTTYEPLSVIANDDPVMCALYAQKHRLLELAAFQTNREESEETPGHGKSVET